MTGALMANGLNVADCNADARQIADPTNPNATINSTGRQANVDQPHAFKVTGVYQAPWDIRPRHHLQSLSGLTRDRTFRATLTQGTTTVLADERGTYRNGDMKLLSVNGHKEGQAEQSYGHYPRRRGAQSPELTRKSGRGWRRRRRRSPPRRRWTLPRLEQRRSSAARHGPRSAPSQDLDREGGVLAGRRPRRASARYKSLASPET